MIGMYWSVLAELIKIAKYKIGMYCAVLTYIGTQNLDTDKYVPNTYTVTEYEQIHTKIRANTYTIHTNTTGAGPKPVC